MLNRNKVIIIIGMIILAFILWTMSFTSVFVLAVSKEGSFSHIFRVQDGTTFSIRWIHSVEVEEWEEFFEVDDRTIFLEATRFKTFGAGVPNDVGEDSFIKDGWLYMTGIHREIGRELLIRAGSNTRHRLIIHNREYLLSVPDHDPVYILELRQMSLIRFYYEQLLLRN